MSTFTPPQHADISRRCRDVLEKMRSAMNGPQYEGDSRQVLLDIRDLIVTHGWAGVGFSVRAWCDAIIDATPQRETGRETMIVFASPDQTEFVAAEHVSTERRWCAQLLAARFSADAITAYQLIEALPRDNNTMIYMFRMAEVAAGILNEYEADPVGPLAPGLYQETAPGVYIRAGDDQ